MSAAPATHLRCAGERRVGPTAVDRRNHLLPPGKGAASRDATALPIYIERSHGTRVAPSGVNPVSAPRQPRPAALKRSKGFVLELGSCKRQPRRPAKRSSPRPRRRHAFATVAAATSTGAVVIAGDRRIVRSIQRRLPTRDPRSRRRSAPTDDRREVTRRRATHPQSDRQPECLRGQWLAFRDGCERKRLYRVSSTIRRRCSVCRWRLNTGVHTTPLEEE
jgi:hypothetical protein